MRLGIVFCGLLAVVATARAAVLPPAVAALEGKVAQAEARLTEVKTQLDAAQARYATLDGQMHALVGVLLRAQGYPPGFWAARSVVANQPGAAGVMGVVVRQSTQELVATQARAAQLAALYGRMNARMAQVREVRDAYADARGRLLVAEKQVLRQAGLEADALAASLEDQLRAEQVGLTAEEMTPTGMAEAAGEQAAAADEGPVWPVVGRVVRAFHTGRGAKAGGVVLKARGGAVVKAPVAGEVLYAGPFRQFGGLIIVKSEDGDNLVLGGLTLLHVNRGNHVVSGQAIGGLGDDGLLYWEVRRGGREINPLRLVRGHG